VTWWFDALSFAADWSNITTLHDYKVFIYIFFLDPEGGSQNATLVVLLVLGISSVKIPKAFVTRSAAQRNFAHTFVLIFPTDHDSPGPGSFSETFQVKMLPLNSTAFKNFPTVTRPLKRSELTQTNVFLHHVFAVFLNASCRVHQLQNVFQSIIALNTCKTHTRLYCN